MAQLIVRARRLLGARYLDAHLPGVGAPLPATCVATRRVLAEVVRGTASATQRDLADSHLAECPACVSASDHLKVVNHRLRTGHVLAVAPAITAAKPVGFLARLVAWLFGSVPMITASMTLVFVAAIAPEAPRRAGPSAPRSVPASVVPAEPVGTSPSNFVDDPASRRPVAPTGQAPATSTAAAGAATDPVVVLGPVTAPTTPPPAHPGAATPAGAVGALPTVGLGTTVDGVTTGLGDTLGTVAQRVTDTAEQTVNGLGLDDPVVGATQPLLDALPPALVGAQVGSVPLGPLGATRKVSVDASTGDGSVDLSVGAGPAGLDLSIGGPSGVQASVPSAAELAAVLPTPNLAGPLLAPG